MNYSYRINLIIGTYGGYYGKENKENYLRNNILILNNIKSNIAQITIMKPKVENNHLIYDNYYNFNDLNIDNIRHKIVIKECENIGISYGQLFREIFTDSSFDYYVFIEDDYLIFIDYFEEQLINYYNSINDDSSLICSFIYKKNIQNALKYAILVGENNDLIESLKKSFAKYDIDKIESTLPDFSLSFFSNNTVKKLKDCYINISNILEIYGTKLNKLGIYQVLYGNLLNKAGVNIYDFSDKYMNIFYETSCNELYLCNFDENIKKWKRKNYYLNIKFDLPLFIPIQMFEKNIYEQKFLHFEKYLKNPEKFKEQIKYLNNIINNTYNSY
jgi:hypothetical protein